MLSEAKNEEVNHIKNNEVVENPSQDQNNFRKKLVKGLYFTAGTICLVLGIIGIVLPILPTTPFLLLAAACYAKSSKRVYNWLLNNRILGSFIRNYLEGKGIPIKVKLFIISMLWIVMLITIFLIVQILWLRIVLLIIAVGVTIHIITIRPKNKSIDVKEENVI